MNTTPLEIVAVTHAHTSTCWWHPLEAAWVCDGAAPQSPLVDVRDMLVVHTALLREFRLMPASVARVAPGATSHAAVVGRHLAFLCDLLHHHHEGEDRLLWPLLRERLTATALAPLDTVEAQHEGIDAALRAVGSARDAWLETAGGESRDRLAAALTRLHALLEAHLDLEETVVLPLAAALLTPAEWGAVGEAAAAAMPKPALALAFGMFAYEGDPAVLRGMLAAAPAVPRVVVPRIAPRLYARTARRVHGTATP